MPARAEASAPPGPNILLTSEISDAASFSAVLRRQARLRDVLVQVFNIVTVHRELAAQREEPRQSNQSNVPHHHIHLHARVMLTLFLNFSFMKDLMKLKIDSKEGGGYT